MQIAAVASRRAAIAGYRYDARASDGAPPHVGGQAGDGQALGRTGCQIRGVTAWPARGNTRCERCRRTPAPVRAAAVAPKSPGGPDSGGSVASRGCRGQGNQNRSWQCRSAPSRSQEDLLPRPVPPHRHRRRGPPRTSQGPLACAAAARLVLPVPVCPLSPVQASQRVVHRACLHRSAGATLATVTPRGLRSVSDSARCENRRWLPVRRETSRRCRTVLGSLCRTRSTFDMATRDDKAPSTGRSGCATGRETQSRHRAD